MEYQCAWCRRTLAQAAASAGCTSISHGICVACMEAMLADLDLRSDPAPEAHQEGFRSPRQAA